MKALKLGGLALALGLSSPWTQAEEKSTAPPTPAKAAASAPAAAPATLAQLAAGDRAAAAAPAAVAAPSACNVDWNNCCESSRVYAGVDLLIWWLRSAHLPPLVTTGDFADNPIGAFGQPGTRLLFGNDNVDAGTFTGARFTVGVQSRSNPNLSVETTWFFLGEEHSRFHAASPGTPGSLIITRPFLNLDAGLQDADVVALASAEVGIRAGSIDVDYSQRLWGFEFNAKSMRSSCSDRQLYVLAGFRFLSLEESLDITEASRDLPFTRGTADFIRDSFEGSNHFYGFQIGAGADVQRGCWTISVVGKLALGVNHREMNLSGFTFSVNQATGETATAGTGLLVQASNRGNHDDCAFAVAPEIGINVRRQITERLSVSAGYSFLYLSDVARPGEHVDLRIGVQTLPAGPTGVQAPVFPGIRDADFWAQGFNIGVVYKF